MINQGMALNGYGARRFVLSIEGDAVTYILPISGLSASCTMVEFEAWLALPDAPPETPIT